MDDPAKSPVYASQNGYGYHGNPPPQGPQGHAISGGECKSVQEFVHHHIISLPITRIG